MTTSAPGACSAPRQRLRSALLFLQRLLHPSRLPLACSIATRWIPGALRAPAPGQGSPDSTGTPRQRSLPCSPPLFCPCGTTDSLAAPQGWVTVPCFGGHSPFSQGSGSPLQGLSPCGGCVPPPSPPLLFLPGQGGGGHRGFPPSTALLPPGTHGAPSIAASPAPVPRRLQLLPLSTAPLPPWPLTAPVLPPDALTAPLCPQYFRQYCPPALPTAPVLPPWPPSAPVSPPPSAPHRYIFCPGATTTSPLAPSAPKLPPSGPGTAPQSPPCRSIAPRCSQNCPRCS